MLSTRILLAPYTVRGFLACPRMLLSGIQLFSLAPPRLVRRPCGVVYPLSFPRMRESKYLPAVVRLDEAQATCPPKPLRAKDGRRVVVGQAGKAKFLDFGVCGYFSLWLALRHGSVIIDFYIVTVIILLWLALRHGSVIINL